MWNFDIFGYPVLDTLRQCWIGQGFLYQSYWCLDCIMQYFCVLVFDAVCFCSSFLAYEAKWHQQTTKFWSTSCVSLVTRWPTNLVTILSNSISNFTFLVTHQKLRIGKKLDLETKVFGSTSSQEDYSRCFSPFSTSSIGVFAVESVLKNTRKVQRYIL